MPGVQAPVSPPVHRHYAARWALGRGGRRPASTGGGVPLLCRVQGHRGLGTRRDVQERKVACLGVVATGPVAIADGESASDPLLHTTVSPGVCDGVEGGCSMVAVRARARSRGVRVKPGRRGGGNSRAESAVLQRSRPVYSATGKVTKGTFTSFLSGKLIVPEPLAKLAWEQLCGLIRSSLTRGRPVCLTNVGTLESYMKQATTYRHPATGEIARTRKCLHVRFHVAPQLKAALRA